MSFTARALGASAATAPLGPLSITRRDVGPQDVEIRIGSAIGGIRETQEMLDFCGEHGITADIERIAASDINRAYERMLESDVKYRFVIDMASLPQA